MRPLLLACLPLLSLAAPDAPPHFPFHELWALQNEFWDNFIYPANTKQINATDETSLLAKDIKGRVDVTRTFTGRELNTEYIFGLFSSPSNAATILGVPTSYNITQLTANQNIISASTVVTFNISAFDLHLPITIDTWATYNAARKLTQYDATFRWVDRFFDTVVEAAGRKFNTTDPVTLTKLLTNLLATSICNVEHQYCKGDNKQYDNKDSCMEFLTGKVRLGKAYELGRNTVLCRSIHEPMVQFRPSVHCAHIGPSGGDYCVDDQSYEEVVLQRYFDQAFIPQGYGDEDNLWVVQH